MSQTKAKNGSPVVNEMYCWNKLTAFAALSVIFGWYFWRPYALQGTWLRINSSPASATFGSMSPSSSDKPVRTTFKVIQFNVDHGGESRLDSILAWLLQQDADVVGFCEANKWQHNLSSIASSAGYEYSEIFPTNHGFPLAVFAKAPIEVLGKHEEHYERGVLHVRVLGVHFFVAHLNAHSSATRELETLHLASLVLPLSSSLLPVVVMGDMNTLSPLNNLELQNTTIENRPLLEALSSLWCYRAMRRKFLNEQDEFAYKPMLHLFAGGLVDASTIHQPTEPTNIPCDQAGQCQCPQLRLDYMLVSNQSAASWKARANVMIDSVTEELSDHFPLQLIIEIQ